MRRLTLIYASSSATFGLGLAGAIEHHPYALALAGVIALLVIAQVLLLLVPSRSTVTWTSGGGHHHARSAEPLSEEHLEAWPWAPQPPP